MNEFIMKDCSVLFTAEIAALPAPRSDCRGHAADQLPNTGLAFGSPSFAVEIFGSDDVGSGHRPAFRHLYVLLFKYDFARFIRNRGSPVFPFDCVVGRHALTREVAPEFQPLFARCPAPISIGFSLEDFLFHVVLLPYIVLFETDCARYRGVGTDQVQTCGAVDGSDELKKARVKPIPRNGSPPGCSSHAAREGSDPCFPLICAIRGYFSRRDLP